MKNLLTLLIFEGFSLILGQSGVPNGQFQTVAGQMHSCFRECQEKTLPMICEYNFTITKHTTMSLDCGDCPHVREDCHRPRCIPGGGLVRTAIAVNTMVPGPAIIVCEDDTIIVNVKNELRTEMVTIHWHGLHQINSFFMDGAPWITQFPIKPFSEFKYKFSAKPHGTQLWHGHVGFQESDGLFGVLNVRRKEPHHIESLYDYDLPEHTIVIWHWYNQPSGEILLPILQRNESVFGYGFLINGKASFIKYPIKGKPNQFSSTPKEVFRVKQGWRYRFRVAYNAAIYCPVQLSIDSHTLLMIAGDTSPYQPVEVDSFMLGAGDRFDFVLHADKAEGCYWLRIRALGDCDESKSSVHSEALICYNDATADDTLEHSYSQAKRLGKLLNPSQIATHDYKEHQLVHLVDLNNTEIEEVDYGGTPNQTIYVQIHSRPYDVVPYPGPWHQFDNVSFKFPREDFIKSQLDEKYLCTEDTRNVSCVGDFCTCTYVKQIKTGNLVEMVLIDISMNRNQDHPVHLHGYKFYIVAMGLNGTLEELKDKNEKGLIPKKLLLAPARDSISVPNRGYAIIRFRANNPGYWMFHCHVTNHMEMGMAMLLQVGSREEILRQCSLSPEQCRGWYNGSQSSLYTVPHYLLLFSLALINFSR